MDIVTIHYLIAALTIALPTCAVGFGQSISTTALLRALDMQPASHAQLKFLYFLGMAMLEFIGILCVFMGILLLNFVPETVGSLLTSVGAASSLMLPATLIGITAAYPMAEIFTSFARQPFMYTPMMRQLLFTQIMLQTPTLFGFVITLLLFNNAKTALSVAAGAKLCAAGLMYGLGVLGPIAGIALFATQACRSMGVNKNSIQHIFSFTLVSQGVIETPVLLVVMMSLYLLFTAPSSGSYTQLIYLSTALCMGLVNAGTGINSGLTARSACKQMDEYPESYSNIANASLISQTFIETTTIYSMIIIFMIFLALPA